jgi:hypothetical protein
MARSHLADSSDLALNLVVDDKTWQPYSAPLASGMILPIDIIDVFISNVGDDSILPVFHDESDTDKSSCSSFAPAELFMAGPADDGAA